MNTDNKLIDNINNLIRNNRLPHAILLDGGNSNERKELAEYIGSAFVCKGTGKPCNNCIDCIKVKNNSHPDVINIDPINDNKENTFKIDVIRELRKDAYILPNEAEYKVYILHCADKMNAQAQNALLKIIEEPPSFVKFIFLCESTAPILETIISRVTIFNLGNSEQRINTNEKAVELSCKIAKALILPTELELLRLTSSFESDKELMKEVLDNLLIIVRDALIIKLNSDKTIGDFTDISNELASKLTYKQIMKMIDAINELKASIDRNANKSLLCTRFSSLLRTTAIMR